MARKWTVANLFCGTGGCALGFQRAGFELVGAIDNDALACKSFKYLTGTDATCADIGAMQPGDLANIIPRRPNVLVLSPPCKGHSLCLPPSAARTQKYKDLNYLALHAIGLAVEAWDTPPDIIMLENVPGITSEKRAGHLLVHVRALLTYAGYVFSERYHNCGELGGLAQNRKRYLLVARHAKTIPEFIYKPPTKRVRGIGEVLRELPVPLPSGEFGGPMHKLGKMHPKGWARLALIGGGRDWKAIPGEVVLADGVHQLPSMARDGRFNGGFGVGDWSEPAHAILAEGSVANTWVSVADPAIGCSPRSGSYGVQSFKAPSVTVIGAACHDNGAFSVADPRGVMCQRRDGGYGVKRWKDPSTTIISAPCTGNGPWQIASPRITYAPRRGTLRVQSWQDPSTTIIGDCRTNKGFSLADIRLAAASHYVSTNSSGDKAIIGPRFDIKSKKLCHMMIMDLDGCWCRPMTDLELAALQSFPVWHNGDWLCFPGNKKQRRQLIGNAIPPDTAEAIASIFIDTLEMSHRGGLLLSGSPIWVDGLPRAGM